MRPIRIHARDVAIATVRPEKLSIRNVLAARILAIEAGANLNVELLLDVDGEHLRARITARRSRGARARVGQRGVRADQERRARELARLPRHTDLHMNVTNSTPSSSASRTSRACRRFWTDFGLAESTAADGATRVQLQERLDRRAAQRRRSDAAAADRARRDAARGDFRRQIARRISTRSPAELERDRPVRVDADGTRARRRSARVRHRVPRRAGASPSRRRSSSSTRRDSPDRINTRGEFFASATPLEMTHTVFMIDEPDKIVPFYTERLGFIASDSYPGPRLFPARRRIESSPQLVPAQRRQEARLPSSRVRAGSSIHELFGGGLNMTRRGWRTALGPGRHPISSCYFWYFHSPCGGAAEYDFDSDVVDERWVPGSSSRRRKCSPSGALPKAWRIRCYTKASKQADTIKDKS